MIRKGYTTLELKIVLDDHKLWDLGKGGSRANLSDANLRSANLSDVNLRGAYLRGANLSDVNLRGAYLRDANLSDANLYNAYLCNVNLRGANLRGANLNGANLSDANLRSANLSDVNLRCANLCNVNLSDADLRDAYLRGANLSDADLSNVIMDWQSHVLIGTRLQQAAGEEYPKLALAGAISQNLNFCWDWWLDNVPNELLGWALSVMITWIRPGDILPKEFEEVVK